MDTAITAPEGKPSLKILWLGAFHPHELDGASTSARALVNTLRNRGHKVDVISTSLVSGGAGSEPQLKLFPALGNNRLECSPALNLHLRNSLHEYDVLHIRGLFNISAMWAAGQARSRGIPYSISPVGNWVPTASEVRSVPHGLRKRLFFQLFCRSALIQARAVICASEAEAQRVTNLCPKARVEIIANGITPELYETPLSHELLKTFNLLPGKYYLFLGRLTPEKNIEFLFRVWQTYLAQNPDHFLVIAGQPEYSSGKQRYDLALKQLMTGYGISQRVVFAGACNGAIKISLLQHAIGLVLPSDNESFGNVVLEALAAGTPVIASTGTPWEALDAIRLGSWLPTDKTIKNRDAAVLRWRDALISWSQLTHHQRQQLRQRSQEYVRQNFSWRSSAIAFEKVFRPESTSDSNSARN